MIMKHHVFRCALTLLILLSFVLPVFAGEKKPAEPKQSKAPDSIATVNGAPITRDNFLVTMAAEEKMYARRGQGIPQTVLPQLKRVVLERLIREELFFQQSKAEGIEVNEELFRKKFDEAKKYFPNEEEFINYLAQGGFTEKSFLAMTIKKTSVRKLLDTKFMAASKPSDADVVKFYKENPREFETPAEVRASHILLKVDTAASPEAIKKAKAEALKEIRAIAKDVKKGTDFGELARKHSTCPSKKNDGDLGFFTKGKMVQPFEDAVFVLEPGQVSDVVETEYGYHLIKLTDKKPGGIKSFDEVKEAINNFLVGLAMNEYSEQYAKDLKKKADVVILDPELKAVPLPQRPGGTGQEENKKK